MGENFDEKDGIVMVQLQNLPQVIGMDIWYDLEKEDLKIKENAIDKKINKVPVNHITRSGKIYQSGKRELSKWKEVAKALLESAKEVEDADAILKQLKKTQAQASI